MSDFEGWCILELMGHRRLAGFVSEVEIAGSKFVRIDIPGPAKARPDDTGEATQFYSAAAVFCITPTTEETAREVARIGRPAPVSRWELPASEPVDTDDADTTDYLLADGERSAGSTERSFG